MGRYRRDYSSAVRYVVPELNEGLKYYTKGQVCIAEAEETYDGGIRITLMYMPNGKHYRVDFDCKELTIATRMMSTSEMITRMTRHLVEEAEVFKTDWDHIEDAIETQFAGSSGS